MWNDKIHERQKFLFQKISHKVLSLKHNMVRRGIHINDTLCLHRCGCVEDEVHVFFSVNLQKNFGSQLHGALDGGNTRVTN